jgi:FKBP12-rapamycin complex-associated protein
MTLPFAEYFEIRELSVAIIGRLSTRNPAYINPTLRSLLLQVLHASPIDNSPLEEETLRMLGLRMLSDMIIQS